MIVKTQLKKLIIEKFRALNNVEVEFGDAITVICGKNGTSKSSILGIAAQIFSFDKDYVKDEPISYKQITGAPFKSKYRDHFRISQAFDTPGSMKVSIELKDGYTNQDATARLELMTRNGAARAVVRNNSTAIGGANTSRNFTHPVIFLSLKRLYPITDRTYEIKDFDYLNTHKQGFINLTNELLNRSSANAIGTGGTISSAVSYGDNYDQESVSAGEDNAGQIVLALMSFRKLKEEYADYKGGLLLIDEADAGLFPTAQINLLKILERECRDLNLQVIMTSHSPVLIEYAFEKSKQFRQRYKTIYLSNTYGDIQVQHDWSWAQINADLLATIIPLTETINLPEINVYFEDGEASDFFAQIMFRQPIKKFTSPMNNITLGCSNYFNLIDHKIAEFSERSIICLDADQQLKANIKYKTIVLLPGHLPPDQLIFEHLYNLKADHPYWQNNSQFTRSVFTNLASEVISEFSITGDQVDIKEKVKQYAGNKRPREIFKRFYKNETIQSLCKLNNPSNPWAHWISENPKLVNEFLNKFKNTMCHVMQKGYSVDSAKLLTLNVKLKRVNDRDENE
ncbi:AAA family ATPase [uncultured Haemophilus sp.]|uniref:AAA family ATPase n=1 Tax=uncultured Haemophilus sp. TaxID=237779 RepID=UPI0025F1343F|nr:AAA family ATPase [uncultured Haemophilus sp.]